MLKYCSSKVRTVVAMLMVSFWRVSASTDAYRLPDFSKDINTSPDFQSETRLISPYGWWLCNLSFMYSHQHKETFQTDARRRRRFFIALSQGGNNREKKIGKNRDKIETGTCSFARRSADVRCIRSLCARSQSSNDCWNERQSDDGETSNSHSNLGFAKRKWENNRKSFQLDWEMD